MILRSSDASPFGRKAKITAKILGIYDQLTVEVANTADPKDTLRQQNPLGKIPILILEDGRKIFDSRVICEYLDAQVDGVTLHPTESDTRWEALTLQALGDGIVDASILQVYENRMRSDDKRDPNWLSYQGEKVTRALDHLAANPPAFGEHIHIGHVAIACALGYLDLRFDGAWRKMHGNMVQWLDEFRSRVPGFDATAFKG
ncbi:glutathione S-transferase N-terminal domain-containing protein [Thalassospira sp. MA62]|nr:glutathione S-transferase N-terminal domain-containing protein [Thalassospira sp. MA62]